MSRGCRHISESVQPKSLREVIYWCATGTQRATGRSLIAHRSRKQTQEFAHLVTAAVQEWQYLERVEVFLRVVKCYERRKLGSNFDRVLEGISGAGALHECLQCRSEQLP